MSGSKHSFTKDNINRINKTLAKAKRYGFCSKLYTFNELLVVLEHYDDRLFSRKTFSNHCLHHLLEPDSSTSQMTLRTRGHSSICQGFMLIWLRSHFLDRCMVLFSFYVEVFLENACVCIRLIGPTYVVVLFIWLFAVFTVIYAVRLIIAFVDVNKTYLILENGK